MKGYTNVEVHWSAQRRQWVVGDRNVGPSLGRLRLPRKPGSGNPPVALPAGGVVESLMEEMVKVRAGQTALRNARAKLRAAVREAVLEYHLPPSDAARIVGVERQYIDQIVKEGGEQS